MTPILASLSSVIPGSYHYNPMAGFLFLPLFAVGLLVLFVEVFVRSKEPRPTMSCQKTCRFAMCLFAALGFLHAFGFIAFAFRAKNLNGGWPRVFQFYDRMQPWTAVFERSEGILCLAGIAAGILALAAAVPVFANWRRRAALSLFRVSATLSASAFLTLYLPLPLLPTAAVEWWFD